MSLPKQAQIAQLQSDIVQLVRDENQPVAVPGTPSAPAEIDLLWRKKRIY